MSRFTYQGNFTTVGSKSDPDILYYNASIVNNTTDDTGTGNVVAFDPPIRFIETRDTALIKDASRYQFSIVRFVVNGANKDLPLFIPQVQSGTGQTDVNLTEYGVGLTWNGTRTSTGNTYAYAPNITYVEYIPETQNKKLAPTPRNTANPNFVGQWSGATTYNQNDIIQSSNGLFYQSLLNNNLNNDPLSPSVLPDPNWKQVSAELGQPQDLSSRYYWVYTYSHWVDLVNTALDTANQTIYNAYVVDFGAGDFATYADWKQYYPPPVMEYDENSGLFSIYMPDAFRQNTPAPPIGGSAGSIIQNAKMELYFNTNMEGLFSNFDNIYFNTTFHQPPYAWTYTPTFFYTPYAVGYTNKILAYVKGVANNVIDGSGVIVSGYTGKYVKMTQDYASTSTLWSPCDSIVFVSTLLPLMNEQTAPPNNIGSGNLGNIQSTSQSAFTPIITDVALDLSTDGAGYRKMIYYAPNAEYRMADFQNSKQDIRSIDIQVFWKNRLDNQLYPLSMFNLSSVSFKLMFRKKSYKDGLGAGKE